MSRGLENTLCVASVNRDLRVNPEPNDFILDLKQRYEAQMIVMGSLEMPQSQYLVEDDWAGFFFDVGLSFPEQCQRTLNVTAPYVQALLALPAPYTPLLYRGAQPDGRSLWCVGPSVQPVCAHGLVPGSLGVLAPVIYHDPTQPPLRVLAVLGPDALLAEPLPAAAALAPGGAGALACADAGARTFRTPQQLCDALNAFFADEHVRLPLRLEYDCVAMALALAVGGPVTVDGSGPNLLQSLGLPAPRAVCELTGLRSYRFPNGAPRRVPVGNYDFGVLRQQLEVLLNPLLQFGTVASASVGVYLYGAAPGAVVNVTLGGFTLYDPKAVAFQLTQQLLAGLGADLVRADFVDDAFELTGASPFRIFWGDSRLGVQLGFDGDLKLARCHRAAPREFVDVPTAVALPAVYLGESTAHLRRLVVSTRGRVQAAQAGGVAAQLTADGAALQAAPGAVPSEYLVGFPQPAGDCLWAVAAGVCAGPMPPPGGAWPAWYTLLRPLAPLPAAPAVGAGTVVPVCAGACNLYFPTTPPASTPRLAEVTGFWPGANLWPRGPDPSLQAPALVCLDPPTYLLLELGLEHMSANCSHRCRDDFKTQLFGKVVLYAPFKLERNYPIQQVATGSVILNRFRVRWWTPWHTLYNFHGRNWSATFVSASPNRPVRTECP